MDLFLLITVAVIALLGIALILYRRYRGYTINSQKPGGSIPVMFPESDSTIEVHLLTRLQYLAPVHPSAGKNYKLEFPENLFKVTYSTLYDDPVGKEEGKPGADAGVMYATLTTLKRGVYEVKIIHEENHLPSKTLSYRILVK